MIQFSVRNLLPKSVYEFRVAYRNASGASEFSTVSKRARTNKAAVVANVP